MSRLLPRFEYLAPRTVEEACSALVDYGDKACVIAGGTDLLVKMKDGVLAPRYLIGLKNLNHLDYIDADTRGIRIGSLATINTIAKSPIIQKRLGILAGATINMATTQIRNMGTIGGNLCNAAPSADTAPPLIAVGAEIQIVGLKAKRLVTLEQFFTGPGKTILEPDELLTEILVPDRPSRWGGFYAKLSLRGAHDIAAVGVAAAVTLNERDECEDCRIVLGAVAPTPVRARKAENIILGKKPNETLLREAGRFAAKEACPISDVRCSDEYRTEMVAVMTRRALSRAFEQAHSAR